MLFGLVWLQRQKPTLYNGQGDTERGSLVLTKHKTYLPHKGTPSLSPLRVALGGERSGFQKWEQELSP